MLNAKITVAIKVHIFPKLELYYYLWEINDGFNIKRPPNKPKIADKKSYLVYYSFNIIEDNIPDLDYIIYQIGINKESEATSW